MFNYQQSFITSSYHSDLMPSAAKGYKAEQFLLPKLTKPRKRSTETRETPEFTVGE